MIWKLLKEHFSVKLYDYVFNFDTVELCNYFLGTDALLDELLTSLDKPNITAAVSEAPKTNRVVRHPPSQKATQSSKPSIKPAPTKFFPRTFTAF